MKKNIILIYIILFAICSYATKINWPNDTLKIRHIIAKSDTVTTSKIKNLTADSVHITKLTNDTIISKSVKLYNGATTNYVELTSINDTGSSVAGLTFKNYLGQKILRIDQNGRLTINKIQDNNYQYFLDIAGGARFNDSLRATYIYNTTLWSDNIITPLATITGSAQAQVNLTDTKPDTAPNYSGPIITFTKVGFNLGELGYKAQIYPSSLQGINGINDSTFTMNAGTNGILISADTISMRGKVLYNASVEFDSSLTADSITVLNGIRNNRYYGNGSHWIGDLTAFGDSTGSSYLYDNRAQLTINGSSTQYGFFPNSVPQSNIIINEKPQIHAPAISLFGAYGGIGFIGSYHDNLMAISRGAYPDVNQPTSNWRSTVNHPSIYTQYDNGSHAWYGNEDIDLDSTYLPTLLMQIYPSGGLTVETKADFKDSVRIRGNLRTNQNIYFNTISGTYGNITGLKSASCTLTNAQITGSYTVYDTAVNSVITTLNDDSASIGGLYVTRKAGIKTATLTHDLTINGTLKSTSNNATTDTITGSIRYHINDYPFYRFDITKTGNDGYGGLRFYGKTGVLPAYIYAYDTATSLGVLKGDIEIGNFQGSKEIILGGGYSEKVGIGTYSPTHILTVNGSLKSTSANIGYDTVTHIFSSTGMWSTGNVVASNDNYPRFLTQSKAVGYDKAQGLTFNDLAGAQIGQIYLYDSAFTGTANSKGDLSIEARFGDIVLANDYSSKIGIGTNAPNYKMTINGGAALTAMQMVNSTTGTASTDGTIFYNSGNDFVVNNIENGQIYFNDNGNLVLTIAASRKVIVNDSTNGIVLDPLSGIRMFGTAQNFDDMGVFNLTQSKDIGATGAPALTATGRGFSLPAFAIGDSLQGSVEHDHRFAEGDTAFFHIHYMTNGTEAGATFVNWSFHYVIFNSGDTATYNGTITYQDTIAANTPSLTHKIKSISNVAVPNVKIGAYVFVVVKRIAASPATNPAANPFGMAVGIHKRINSIGSKQVSTK